MPLIRTRAFLVDSRPLQQVLSKKSAIRNYLEPLNGKQCISENPTKLVSFFFGQEEVSFRSCYWPLFQQCCTSDLTLNGYPFRGLLLHCLVLPLHLLSALKIYKLIIASGKPGRYGGQR